MVRKIIGVRWFTGGTNAEYPTVGIVITENNRGERRLYIGAGLGLDMNMDIETIADYGAKIDLVDLTEFMSQAIATSPENIHQVRQIRAQDPQAIGPDEPSTWVQIEAHHAAQAATRYAADLDDQNDGEIARGDKTIVVEVRPLSPRPAAPRTSERYLVSGKLAGEYTAVPTGG